ncbi:MAG: hypothetical protein GFH27_549283n60 [Chloroflexi bacterium AL-W]|nr:hypothetical protein [Chloroflexi bacterium AL-N1]NOK64819.1 hypothetical protein [Chloroflexi bacterium AL-N10]NOK76589.1 hypothetical protein [Chloroflexi bacterium AL-N5]NOK80181.1 hypothetical protein [Chloroflexi bacterium AL-W]NOK86694.1 hypothetical protein [Chloroflexi bacterium AL-N15]
MVIRMIVQIVIICIWAVMLGAHTRRLCRLARVEVSRNRQRGPIRQQLGRMWWWLGREEFWENVQVDSFRCVQVTVMLLVTALTCPFN